MISKKLKAIFLILIILASSAGYFFYFRYNVYYSLGTEKNEKIFKIEKGEGNGIVSDRLEKEGLISGNIYFYYYMRNKGLLNKILPGEYELSGRMTIPEIASMITKEKDESVKITFPEGWDSKKMAERLSANGFDGDKFLSLAEDPPAEITEKYSFFSLLPEGTSLEGYLFPDTYFFSRKLTPEEIVKKILANFDERLDSELRGSIREQGRSLEDIITMASIIEKEVRSDEDRKIVSGLFWDRVKIGQPLQSCATISYVLGVNKKQYTFEDTRIGSPYNTYMNKGLPPGPIANPGLSSIRASIYPKESDYNYFLSDPETGKTVFSRTIEEHNANKDKFGL